MRVCICMHACMHACVCICVCICVCMCICASTCEFKCTCRCRCICITLRCITLHFIIVHYILGPCITLHHITSHHITSRYITLHAYAYVHPHIRTYIHTWLDQSTNERTISKSRSKGIEQICIQAQTTKFLFLNLASGARFCIQGTFWWFVIEFCICKLRPNSSTWCSAAWRRVA